MSDLIKHFVDGEISRRDFARGLTALGLSSLAAGSLVTRLAAAREPAPGAGEAVSGSASEILVEVLRAADVRYIFAGTATGMSPFFDALAVRDGPQLILSVAESQATSMAHGYELASGKTSVLFVPGVAIPSTMNNLYNAWKDRSSIVVLADSASGRFPYRDGFQQMEDWLSPLLSFTKRRWQVDHPRHLAEMTRRAFTVAGTQPGGPVHVRIPLDVLAAGELRETIYPQQRFSVPAAMPPRPELVEQTARWLLEAEHPMICAGSEITRAGANDALVELAELMGIPVAQGFSVYGDFPFRHPLFAGFYGLGVPRDLGRTDLFLNLGAGMPDPTLFAPPPPRRARLVHARIDYQQIAQTHATDIAIAGGMKETITALSDTLRGMASSRRLRQLSEQRLASAREYQAQEDQRRREAAQANWNASPLSWERVSAELDQALAEDAIVINELNYRTPLHWLDFDRGRKWLIGQTTGYALGWGIGAALGAKMALPDRQVCCLLGDGALLFGQPEALWSAARYEIPVIIIVMNNLSYDNERNRIKDRSPLLANRETREQWRDMSCWLGNPTVDFAAMAQSFGVPAVRAENPEEFVRALARASAITREGQACLIDTRIMQVNRRGEPTRADWYPQHSIAARRSRLL